MSAICLKINQPGIKPVWKKTLYANLTAEPNVQMKYCDTTMLKKLSRSAASCRSNGRLQKLHSPIFYIPKPKVSIDSVSVY